MSISDYMIAKADTATTAITTASTPATVYILFFICNPITSSNTSSSKEMPHLLIYLSRLQRPASPSECLVCISGYTPLQRRTRCLINTIPSSLTAATPYVPVLVRHLWLSCCCKLRCTVPLWCPRCAVHSLTVQPHHLIPAWS